MPIRVQLSRAKGWRMPAGTVRVDRATMWGNWAAHRVGAAGAAAVDEFKAWIENEASDAWKGRAAIDLRGKNLACWCKLTDPCHADVSVSYTHLRAHETGRNLVCRLLLEKKKH